ncbi:hypothetical protein CG709_01795, partial [Lachnotalea glycerini]
SACPVGSGLCIRGRMFTMARSIAASQKSMVPFVAAAVFYYVFNFAVAGLMELWEKKMSYYR